MTFDPASMFSNIARSGPPLFYPDPPVPVTFNFDQNVPDEDTFPIDDLLAVHEEVLKRDGGRALEYISFGRDEKTDRILYLSTYIELVLGNTGLREEVAKWLMRRQGVKDLVADSIILASGSVAAVGLAIDALIDDGDVAFVEASTFPYALRYFEMRGAHIRPVPLDAEGMDMEALEEALKEARAQGRRPKMVYIIPTFQMPTSACTSLERRRRLLELADEYDLVVIEDNVYGDLRYSGDSIPTLLSLDTAGRVLQTHSFSKILVPGIRLGWAAARPEMIAGLAAVRQDLGVSQWTSRAMALYLERDMLDPHLERILPHYRHKLEVTVETLRQHCEPYVSFNVPDGGYFLWLTLAEGVDWEKARLGAQENGILFRPGERFMGPDRREVGQGHFRLAFSHVREDEIRRGIAALGEAMAKAAI